MLAVGCTLLVALLAAPTVALVLGSCRALGKRSRSGRGECDTVWFRWQSEPRRYRVPAWG